MNTDIMMNEKYKKQIEMIKWAFPLKVSDVSIHDNGDDFLVLEVNHGWIFRFPRRELSRQVFLVEKAFLARFKSISPLPIPVYRHAGSDFGEYRKLQGSLLTRDVFSSLNGRVRGRIARQLGQFLSAIHGFPVADAQRLGVSAGWDGFY
jgi:aminoglycoside 2''-phosphotransferase